ncbi:MFS transporter [Methylopila turkensis]|uniref:MFS transporter n=1 Tax=Methylopila turkensis TaxID=1437816 RepID=A0A9W6N658_9HYPH|nr:MFS transporter [Methylopila turkensis]GLK79108.1 MFS transporter [Methylopila turkensis]
MSSRFAGLNLLCEERAPDGRLSILLASGLGMYLSVGIFLIYGFSVFIDPIAAETGWSRAGVAAAIAPVGLITGIMSPVIGLMTDRFGPRRVLIFSSLAMSVGLIGIGLGSQTLSSLLVWVALASLLGSAQTGVAYSQIIVGWFHERRGAALGLTLAFSGLGIATVPPLLSLAIEAFGWRMALVIAGVCAAMILSPVALFMLRDPRRGELRSPDRGGWSVVVAAALTRDFWLLLTAFLLTALVALAGSVSLPMILTDRGATPETAALAMTVVGVALVLARLGFGASLDRCPPRALTCLAFIAPAMGHLLLAATDGVTPAFVSAALFGFAVGAEGDAMGYLLARRFGTAAFGRIYGINYLAFCVGAGAGPSLLVALLSADGPSSVMAFGVAGLLGSVAPLLMLLVSDRTHAEGLAVSSSIDATEAIKQLDARKG